MLDTALSVAERHDDDAGLAETEWNLAQTCYHRRDREGAVRHGRRARAVVDALAQSIDDPALRGHFAEHAAGAAAPEQ